VELVQAMCGRVWNYRKMSFVEIEVLHILLSFEGIVGLPVYQFNKGGNCKLQGGLFIIGKFSMGLFNI
jgi:hypothetical protein